AGEEIRALELLQTIPRSSPLADWRFFVRGLAAFRRNDLPQAQANWERLDPQRAAQKIAGALQSMVGSAGTKQRPGSLSILETKQFGEPVLERIDHLQRAIEARDWKRVLQLIAPIRRTLQR